MKRLMVMLALVVMMGMVLVLCRAESMRVGRELVNARQVRDGLRVQYDRLLCQRSAAHAPDFVKERIVAMGLDLVSPGSGPEVMYARASR